MADSDRVVFPDEVGAIRTECKAQSEAEQIIAENEVEAEPSPTEAAQAQVTTRNMIQAPSNCPDGYEMDANGVCREVF